MTEKPRYRITAEGGEMLLSGLLWPLNSEVAWVGWPTAKMAPLNEPAKRIFQFWERWRGDGQIVGRFKPPTSSIANAIVLATPATIGRRERRPNDTWPSARIPDVPKPREIFPGMPEYEIASDAWYGADILAAGSKVVCCAWPTERHLLKPANDPAMAVASYFAEFEKHSDLLPGSWDEFSRAVVLPDLPRQRLPASGARR